ncbi:MAG: hybrid sensor histidine kinase/response regulator [Desulfobacteraceae bacterium]|nr:MAG: hybrid sensor histidine kinase/response regulator [Desulfobacteraceae bacterium]
MKPMEPSRKGKILIVDDAPSVARFTSEILKTEYHIRIVSNGVEALEVISTYHPDIVLLDVVMPGMNGIEVCKKIRTEKSFAFMKIIMISSKTHIEERIQGYEAGADDYIGKPFKKEELLAKVRVFYRLKLVEDQLHEMNEKLNEQVRIRTDQLIDSARMAAIGKSTAGIVHNLNNPLQAILGYSELLELKSPENPMIQKLRSSAMLMKEMIATILTTSREENCIKVDNIDLNTLLRNQIEMMKANNFFKHQVKTEIDLQPLPLYKGVYAHFSQSLGNLIKNAVDAMYQTANKVLSVQTKADEQTIQITISDTGCGMDPETLPKIFDPFFTTKPLSAPNDEPCGTGIGLASTQEMIEAYGGKIDVESRTGIGSRFTVTLPLIIR